MINTNFSNFWNDIYQDGKVDSYEEMQLAGKLGFSLATLGDYTKLMENRCGAQKQSLTDLITDIKDSIADFDDNNTAKVANAILSALEYCNDYNSFRAILDSKIAEIAPTTEGSTEVNVEDIVDKFSKGEVTEVDFITTLHQCCGVSNVSSTNKCGNIVVTFDYNNKHYEVQCNADAAFQNDISVETFDAIYIKGLMSGKEAEITDFFKPVVTVDNEIQKYAIADNLPEGVESPNINSIISYLNTPKTSDDEQKLKDFIFDYQDGKIIGEQERNELQALISRLTEEGKVSGYSESSGYVGGCKVTKMSFKFHDREYELNTTVEDTTQLNDLMLKFATDRNSFGYAIVQELSNLGATDIQPSNDRVSFTFQGKYYTIKAPGGYVGLGKAEVISREEMEAAFDELNKCSDEDITWEAYTEMFDAVISSADIDSSGNLINPHGDYYKLKDAKDLPEEVKEPTIDGINEYLNTRVNIDKKIQAFINEHPDGVLNEEDYAELKRLLYIKFDNDGDKDKINERITKTENGETIAFTFGGADTKGVEHVYHNSKKAQDEYYDFVIDNFIKSHTNKSLSEEDFNKLKNALEKRGIEYNKDAIKDGMLSFKYDGKDYTYSLSNAIDPTNPVDDDSDIDNENVDSENVLDRMGKYNEATKALYDAFGQKGTELETNLSPSQICGICKDLLSEYLDSNTMTLNDLKVKAKELITSYLTNPDSESNPIEELRRNKSYYYTSYDNMMNFIKDTLGENWADLVDIKKRLDISSGETIYYEVISKKDPGQSITIQTIGNNSYEKMNYDVRRYAEAVKNIKGFKIPGMTEDDILAAFDDIAKEYVNTAMTDGELQSKLYSKWQELLNSTTPTNTNSDKDANAATAAKVQSVLDTLQELVQNENTLLKFATLTNLKNYLKENLNVDDEGLNILVSIEPDSDQDPNEDYVYYNVTSMFNGNDFASVPVKKEAAAADSNQGFDGDDIDGNTNKGDGGVGSVNGSDKDNTPQANILQSILDEIAKTTYDSLDALKAALTEQLILENNETVDDLFDFVQKVKAQDGVTTYTVSSKQNPSITVDVKVKDNTITANQVANELDKISKYEYPSLEALKNAINNAGITNYVTLEEVLSGSNGYDTYKITSILDPEKQVTVTVLAKQDKSINDRIAEVLADYKGASFKNLEELKNSLKLDFGLPTNATDEELKQFVRLSVNEPQCTITSAIDSNVSANVTIATETPARDYSIDGLIAVLQALGVPDEVAQKVKGKKIAGWQLPQIIDGLYNLKASGITQVKDNKGDDVDLIKNITQILNNEKIQSGSTFKNKLYKEVYAPAISYVRDELQKLVDEQYNKGKKADEWKIMSIWTRHACSFIEGFDPDTGTLELWSIIKDSGILDSKNAAKVLLDWEKKENEIETKEDFAGYLKKNASTNTQGTQGYGGSTGTDNNTDNTTRSCDTQATACPVIKQLTDEGYVLSDFSQAGNTLKLTYKDDNGNEIVVNLTTDDARKAAGEGIKASVVKLLPDDSENLEKSDVIETVLNLHKKLVQAGITDPRFNITLNKDETEADIKLLYKNELVYQIANVQVPEGQKEALKDVNESAASRGDDQSATVKPKATYKGYSEFKTALGKLSDESLNTKVKKDEFKETIENITKELFKDNQVINEKIEKYVATLDDTEKTGEELITGYIAWLKVTFPNIYEKIFGNKDTYNKDEAEKFIDNIMWDIKKEAFKYINDHAFVDNYYESAKKQVLKNLFRIDGRQRTAEEIRKALIAAINKIVEYYQKGQDNNGQTPSKE